MFEILHKANQLSFFYKIQNLSKFTKSLVILYFCIFASLYFIYEPLNVESTNEYAPFLLLSILLIIILSAIYITINDSDYLFTLTEFKELNKTESEMIFKLDLHLYLKTNVIYRKIRENIINDEYLNSKEVKNYITFLKNDKEKLNKSETWFLNLYKETLDRKEKLYSSTI